MYTLCVPGPCGDRCEQGVCACDSEYIQRVADGAPRLPRAGRYTEVLARGRGRRNRTPKGRSHHATAHNDENLLWIFGGHTERATQSRPAYDGWGADQTAAGHAGLNYVFYNDLWELQLDKEGGATQRRRSNGAHHPRRAGG